LGLRDEARTAGAILGHNFQSTEWYDRAYDLLTKQGLKPGVFGTSWLSEVHRQVIKGQWL
jgi:outer membrane protein assembly factor BamD